MASCCQIKVGVAHSTDRLIGMRIARAFASFSIQCSDWNVAGGRGVCQEICTFCRQRREHVGFALLVLTSLAEEIRGKQCHESRKHRLLVQTALRGSASIVMALLQALCGQDLATQAPSRVRSEVTTSIGRGDEAAGVAGCRILDR